LTALLVCTAAASVLAQSQSAPARPQPAQRESAPAPQPAARPAPTPPAGAAPAAPAQPNTTVITRTPDRPAAGDKGRGTAVSLQARLTDAGGRIDQGLVWRIYEAAAGADGRHKLVSTHKEGAPTVRLPPGEYMINAAFGRAHLTRKVVVTQAETQAELFVLNAGGLRITAVSATGEAVPERAASYDIYSDERDQKGTRAKVMSGARLGLIYRLNAGIYHVVSTYGDANAIERADVTVEPGKLSEAVIRHQAARATFKLVARAGGEALADVKWAIQTPDGHTVKESMGALPTHLLQAGKYLALATQADTTWSLEFEVKAGEVKQVELVMQ
jgi:hypothetical protein